MPKGGSAQKDKKMNASSSGTARTNSRSVSRRRSLESKGCSSRFQSQLPLFGAPPTPLPTRQPSCNPTALWSEGVLGSASDLVRLGSSDDISGSGTTQAKSRGHLLWICCADPPMEEGSLAVDTQCTRSREGEHRKLYSGVDFAGSAFDELPVFREPEIGSDGKLVDIGRVPILSDYGSAAATSEPDLDAGSDALPKTRPSRPALPWARLLHAAAVGGAESSHGGSEALDGFGTGGADADAAAGITGGAKPLALLRPATAPPRQSASPRMLVTFERPEDGSEVEVVFTRTPLGVVLSPTAPMKVQRVEPASQALELEVRVGWIVREINGHKLPTKSFLDSFTVMACATEALPSTTHNATAGTAELHCQQ
eukprot:NODE_12101_length_1246_cov_4.508490.p1 GENE.NODE_12101_length_1246_cov_4.508490~~NODE_12101_length_1246_cov_4.508490.p1  ORF type:complete len:369 (-),score=61.73 NODE_12101_length_1246_cov_4.508490:87-1193(-)